MTPEQHTRNREDRRKSKYDWSRMTVLEHIMSITTESVWPQDSNLERQILLRFLSRQDFDMILPCAL